MNKIDYEKEYKNLILELITEKQEQIKNMKHEIQIQIAMAEIQYQNAIIQKNCKVN